MKKKVQSLIRGVVIDFDKREIRAEGMILFDKVDLIGECHIQPNHPTPIVQVIEKSEFKADGKDVVSYKLRKDN